MVQEAWLGGQGAPPSPSESSVPRDLVEWAAQTKSNLNSLRALRKEASSQIQRDKLVFSANTKVFGDPPDRGLGTAAVEDKLKKRIAASQQLSAIVSNTMVALEQHAFYLRQSAHDMQRSSGIMRGSLAVAEKRLEMRAKRPQTELVPDEFQESLEAERDVLIEARQELANQTQVSRDMLKPLESTRDELHTSKLSMQYDRTGRIQELIDSASWLEDRASKLVVEARSVLEREERRVAQATKHTISSMKTRVAATLELRRQLEKEIKETRATIAQAELDLERTQKQLKAYLSQPEHFGKQHNDRFDALDSRVQAQLSKLRQKIKGACYTGHAGRQLDVLFGRFDRDGSGQLEEEEVRRALRRTLRIPPSIVTDAEISSLCSILDADQSGSVGISEILDFLSAETNAEALEDQSQRISGILNQLRSALQQSMLDLRCKTAAWKIDEACSRVNPIKGLELDNLPSPGRKLLPPASPGKAWSSPERQASARSADQDSPQSRRNMSMSLDSAAVEAVRSKLKAAAYIGHTGRQLDVVFSRFDKDGTGRLEDTEVRQAVRRTLRIPPSVITDAELTSLCYMLDADNDGTVSISELINFVGREPEISKRTGKPLAGASLEPINRVDSSGMTQPESPAKATSARSRKRGPPLSTEQQEKVRSRIRSAVKSTPSDLQLDAVFGRYEDSSGRIADDEVRLVLRRTFRISASVVSDAEILSLCGMLDTDRVGTVGVHEIVAFIGVESDTSTRTRPLTGQALEPINKADSRSAGSQSNDSPQRKGKQQSASARRRCPPLAGEQIDAVRSKLRAAANSGRSSTKLDGIFKVFDKDGSGKLEDDEVRIAIRKTLRIPAGVMSDAEIYSLCALLDSHGSGKVKISEIVGFVASGLQAGNQTSESSQAANMANPLMSASPRDAA